VKEVLVVVAAYSPYRCINSLHNPHESVCPFVGFPVVRRTNRPQFAYAAPWQRCKINSTEEECNRGSQNSVSGISDSVLCTDLRNRASRRYANLMTEDLSAIHQKVSLLAG
jgi:hypothetical protein